MVRLRDLDWGERVVGGVMKSHYTIAHARFVYDGKSFAAVEWVRRVGTGFNAYASAYVVAELTEETADQAVMKKLVVSFGRLNRQRENKIIRSETVDQPILLCSDPKDDLELSVLLDQLK